MPNVTIPTQYLQVVGIVRPASFDRPAVVNLERSGRPAPLAPMAAGLEYAAPDPRRFSADYPKIIPRYSHGGGSRSAAPTASMNAATTSSRAVLFVAFTRRRLPASSWTM